MDRFHSHSTGMFHSTGMKKPKKTPEAHAVENLADITILRETPNFKILFTGNP